MGLSRRRLLHGAPLLALGACASGAGRGQADLVFTGGDVHVADSAATRHSALAVRGNQIVAVGSNADINALAGPRTRRVALDGRTVLPGINDSHLHLLMWSLGQPPFSLDVSFPAVRSIADVVSLVGAEARRRPQGDWIAGRGWDQPYLEEGRAPTRHDLDAVAPDHPVALTEFSGHAVWANTAALKLAGITRDTVPPVGGVIVKDELGEPTGLLFEGAAWAVRDAVPDPTPSQNKAALRAGMQALLARGITSCTVPGIAPEILQQMSEIAREPDINKLRVTALVRSPDNLDALGEVLREFDRLDAVRSPWFQTPGVKIMGDGIPTMNRTAWLHDDYVGGGNGTLLIAGETHDERVAELGRMVALIHGRRQQLGIHVTGDRSIDAAVAACLAAQTAEPFADPRHYLIHADLISPPTLRQAARAGIGVNFNPEIKHLIADSQVYAIGVTRAAYEWPYRTALDSGAIVASSSDAPVTAGNWLQGISTMVSRVGKQSGRVSGPEQKIALDEAIRTYTWAGAWQDRAESYKGTLAVGQVADLCVLQGRIDAIASDQLPAAGVALTVVDGRVVHDALT
ncbi:MAG: amidohydrolase [Pseudomonadota bacterium]